MTRALRSFADVDVHNDSDEAISNYQYACRQIRTACCTMESIIESLKNELDRIHVAMNPLYLK